MPAKVEGTWKFPHGELTLKQRFQMISGTLKSGSKSMPIINGKLNGDQISFTAGRNQYTGRISGKGIDGTIISEASWKATRAAK